MYSPSIIISLQMWCTDLLIASSALKGLSSFWTKKFMSRSWEMTHELQKMTRKESWKGTFKKEVFYEQFSSSNSTTSSCGSLNSFSSSHTFTKAESCAREVHFAGKSLFPEFFAKNLASKSPLKTEPNADFCGHVLKNKGATGPQMSYPELEERIKGWFIREFGLENHCVWNKSGVALRRRVARWLCSRSI